MFGRRRLTWHCSIASVNRCLPVVIRTRHRHLYFCIGGVFPQRVTEAIIRSIPQVCQPIFVYCLQVAKNISPSVSDIGRSAYRHGFFNGTFGDKPRYTLVVLRTTAANLTTPLLDCCSWFTSFNKTLRCIIRHQQLSYVHKSYVFLNAGSAKIS